DRGDVDLGAHAALARLGRAVADGGACARRAAPADGPRRKKEALEQAGLAREIRPAQRHHAVRAAAWSASEHCSGFEVGHDCVLLLRHTGALMRRVRMKAPEDVSRTDGPALTQCRDGGAAPTSVDGRLLTLSAVTRTQDANPRRLDRSEAPSI